MKNYFQSTNFKTDKDQRTAKMSATKQRRIVNTMDKLAGPGQPR